MDRRAFLATVGTAAGATAGCLGSGLPGGGTPGLLDPVAGTWPTYQFDSARTGHVPEPGTPPEDRTGGWTFPTSVGRTPTVADGVVYVCSVDGFLAAIDATTGEETWRFEADAGEDATFWATPVPSGDTLYAHGDSGVFALDRETGEPNWRVEPEVERLRPRTLAVVDGTVVLERGRTVVAGLDASSGEERWRYDVGEYATNSSLAVADGTVYFAALDGTVHAVGIDAGRRRWRREVTEGRTRGVSVVDGTVYLTSNSVHAVDAESGDPEWTLDVHERATLDDCPNDGGQSGSGGFPASQPAVAGGRLFVRYGECHVVAVETESGDVAWSAKIPGPRRAPVVVGDRLYVSADDGVVTLDSETGERTGPTFGTPLRPSTAPVVVDGVVFVGVGGRDADALVASTAG